ncbi:MAG: sigma-70 family RNA polymerase sigma factor [Armatimonadetes bacterium]|nr:sigma-70 family RNA polymerase sigma factor [Armatimonadota bacterium]
MRDWLGQAGADAGAVRRVLAGDAEAYAELVERHRHWAVNLAYHLIGDAEEAEDVAQEAFVIAYSKLHQLRSSGAFGPWLRRILVNLASRRRRRLSRRSAAEIDPTGVGEATNSTAVAVHAVLRLMPDHLAVVLVLRELHSLSYREIAETLSIPVGTVRSRLHAAREMFRRLWDAE